MTWPANCIRGVDLSANQDTLDIDKFVKANPDVKRYVLRAGNAFGKTDAKFGGWWGIVDFPDAYVWPDPLISLAAIKARWQEQVPPDVGTVWLDCEWSAATWKQATGKTPIRSITDDTRESLRILTDLFPSVGIYTRGNWWAENIREHGWEKDYKFWIAHYPMTFAEAPGYRQCRTFREIEIVIAAPDYAAFPYIGRNIPFANVVGWQFSDHGRLPGYDKNLDLSLWIPQTPPKPTLEETVAGHEKRIGALEGR